ncbi:D-alanyl-D-alanine carboxypeptidase [Halalkalibacillus sediminis]|uniref:serine-type D-Ala-D-Ala carboxypeptidase n=1 Tax=Halalkalibacillus sediminis TaxID=2018042 RepID=A0A2I0QYK4_9BACI|nr:D-alanyl-D-alanine carboxypeptidase family protein [Halalkalibacillus sediminis]PKR79389.1 D-alanyl-D-alanine carboxypeptidase [Halalkalibacillus sediminis]
MKKLIIGFIALIMLMPSGGLYAEEVTSLTDHAKSAVLVEVDTQEVLYNHNSHEKLPPASMTKLMTMLLIMEELNNGNLSLDENVRISEHASSMGGTQIYLEPFEEMSVQDLLKGVTIASANDASVALAERISGSEKAFVEEMNKKVKELGLENTHFNNVTGLPTDNHYSSAYDMAMIGRELLQYEEILDYTKVYEDYLRKGTDDEFWLVNTNKLVKFYQGVDGLKTGYTSEAKFCLTATAKRGDMRVISVVMGADTAKNRNQDISNMLDYAFSQYEIKRLYQDNQTVLEKSHPKAKGTIKVGPEESISLLMKKGDSMDDYETVIEENDSIHWPVARGDQLGSVKLMKESNLIKEYPLVITEEVEQASIWNLWKKSITSIHRGN